MLVARHWLTLALTLAAPLACTLAIDDAAQTQSQTGTAPTPAPAELGARAEPRPTPTPSFDPASATKIRARIVAVPSSTRWVSYGSRQLVGALEVEVLEVGEPAPQMLVFVACPSDRCGDLFVVGATHVFGLYPDAKPWPAVEAREDLPARYVKSVADAPD